MRINDDLTKPVIVHAGRLDWVKSPAAGVDRRMLYRVGDEMARATSIVRYAPGSAFPRHVHSGGEEILVLEGTFQDEPAAALGCVIFVRLWQFREGDDTQIVRQPGEGEPAPLRDGAISARTLFDDGAERVVLEDWRANATVIIPNERGLEFILLSGDASVNGEKLEAQSWGRLPAGQALTATVGSQGALVWFKDAALLHENVLQLPQ